MPKKTAKNTKKSWMKEQFSNPIATIVSVAVVILLIWLFFTALTARYLQSSGSDSRILGGHLCRCCDVGRSCLASPSCDHQTCHRSYKGVA